MADAERQQLINRFEELADRADKQGFWTDTEFLTLAEQDTLCSLRLAVPYALHAGYPDGERKVAALGSEELFGCEYPSPIVCVKIAPASQKFADKLTHRDFLGALMGLGVRREVMGDILIADNIGYLFCLESIAPYIIDTLTEVKRTTVRCGLSEPPTALLQPPPITSVVIASERLDAIISAVRTVIKHTAEALGSCAVLAEMILGLFAVNGAFIMKHCLVFAFIAFHDFDLL